MKKLTATMLLLVASLAVHSVAASNTAGAPRHANLTGAAEVPVPGDPDGKGFARITLNVGRMRVCWEITVTGVVPATAAHIHSAPAGIAGPVAVPLSPPTSGSSSGCRENVDRALVQAIIDSPANYYVNVHNAVFLEGALRGQLSNPGQAK